MWDNKVFSVVETIKSKYYIVTVGNFVGINGLIVIVNM